MLMHVTEEILHTVDIEDKYIQNDGRQIYIIESVDSISRDGPDMPYM